MAQPLIDFSFKGTDKPLENLIRTKEQFNGYTTYWGNEYKEWIRYGNLHKLSIPDREKIYAQSKIDIAEDLQIPGLSIQTGFINGLISEEYKTLEDPSLKALEVAVESDNVLVLVNSLSPAGKLLLEKYPSRISRNYNLKSYQFADAGFIETDAFFLEHGGRSIFIISSKEKESLRQAKELIDNTLNIIKIYDLHKGWFGASTNIKSTTGIQGHPMDYIGKWINEGNTWFVFNGFKDYLLKDEVAAWVNNAGLPVITDVGVSPVYGCIDYNGFAIEEMKSSQSWIDFAKNKGGYVFRQVHDPESDPYQYDGYFAIEGNKEQIDHENFPFVSINGSSDNSMVLFVKKGEKLSRELMWEAIMDRREVAVLDLGKMMGPAQYRNALQMLWLDSLYLVNYFSERINNFPDVGTDHSKPLYDASSLYKMRVPDVENLISQSKVDIAKDIQMPGLNFQEGFINGLVNSPFKTIENPSLKELEDAMRTENVLVLTKSETETGKALIEKFVYGGNNLSSDNSITNAFILEKGSRKIFVIASQENEKLKQFKEFLDNTLLVLKNYDLHKGWFGAATLLKSVTCVKGHPLEWMGKGMNEGNSWFVFSGYMEFLAKAELESWIKKVSLPVVTDVGFSPIYGCKDYDGLQVQDMKGQQAWIDFAHDKSGYIFRQVIDTASDRYKYDGYIAAWGNRDQINNDNIPFISITGDYEKDFIPSMVLFINKEEKLSRDIMWKAIMDRRAVAVIENGKMMGPDQYRNALQMLLLDRVFLEDYFGDRINIYAEIIDYTLHVTISNSMSHTVSGKLDLKLPSGVKAEDQFVSSLSIPAGSSKEILIKLMPLAGGMNETNPVVAEFKWADKKKTTMAILDMPPAITVHQLMYSHAPLVKFPVSILNFSVKSPFPVSLEVFEKDKPDKAVFTAKKNNNAESGKFENMLFDLKLKEGDYIVKVSALGTSATSQLGVGKPEGNARAYAIDLNNDGIDEFRLENDSVQITLIATGARVIKYIVKSRNDNVLFKLWPDKPVDYKRPFRKRSFYPYGGFEDFLGQPSIETHHNYEATLIKDKGDYVQVKMHADYYGNKIEKIFTLYGNSPLLEVKFALSFINPELNVLGPQPILELGEDHGVEDVFHVPAIQGIETLRMRPEDFYGRIFNMKEGWNAGYDEKEDVTFVGAFPVSQPLFNHMWMNHPKNGSARFYYVEFQPWVPITQKNTMYFSYYLWGTGGKWEDGVKELRKRNLITEQ